MLLWGVLILRILLTATGGACLGNRVIAKVRSMHALTPVATMWTSKPTVKDSGYSAGRI